MGYSAETATARVPAWKRLGLKLKQSGAAPEPADETLPAVGHPSSRTQQSQTPSKRKLEAPPAGDCSSVAKKPRTENQSVDRNTQLIKKKSVTFGDTPTKNGPAKQPQPKKSKSPAKKQAQAPSTDIKPALEYLKQWHSARDSWKFNKNHQSALIKYIFDPDLFPATEVDLFYAYIQDIKGFVRTRLIETAMEFRTKDSMQGASGFPEGTVNLGEKQMAYEALLAQLLHTQSGKKRKVFNEVEYRRSTDDVDEIIRRVVKRMRAEMVLGQLWDGEETDTSTTTASSGTMSLADSDTTKTTDGDKRVKLNDGTGKRRRKLRTNVDESSSSSESESDSDTSSSGSSDDSDDDDDDEKEAEDGNESSSGESSSSSSSSSSSDEDDEDSEDESEDDA